MKTTKEKIEVMQAYECWANIYKGYSCTHAFKEEALANIHPSIIKTVKLREVSDEI